jgi:F-type H+-transporting ATPase subunit epsilon
MDTIKLEITTPAGRIFASNVKEVTLPGSEGEFGVLPGHASLVSLLSAGVIELLNNNGKKESVAIDWGYVEVTERSVTVLADGAVAIAGDTDSKLAESLAKAKQLLKEAGDSNFLLASTEAKIEATARGAL